MGKIFFLLLFLFAGAVRTLAQTPVPVRDEPRHHLVFENPYVRILDVWIEPGDTTQYHIHATPSVFVTFTNPRVGSQLLGGNPAAGAGISGTVSYDSIAVTRVHRVWNEGGFWFHVMDLELVSKIPGAGESALRAKGLLLLFDKPQVRGYHLELTKGQTFSFPSSQTGYLVLSMGVGHISLKDSNGTDTRELRAGHYEWIGTGRSAQIICDSDSAAFTILQMK